MLIKRLADWLRPGGCLLVNLGVSNNPGFIDPNWLGTAMYWSGYGAKTNREMIQRAGLTLIEAEILCDDGGKLVSFLWLLATKEDVANEEHINSRLLLVLIS